MQKKCGYLLSFMFAVFFTPSTTTRMLKSNPKGKSPEKKYIPRKTSDELMNEVLVVLNQCTNTEEKLLIVNRVSQHLSATMDISEDKITKCIGEFISCAHLSLDWIKNKNQGHDAIDNLGRPCEIKTFTSLEDSKISHNIQYKFPCIAGKTETIDQWRDRVKRHFLSNTGGHYWVGLGKRKTEVDYHWHLENAKFANYIEMFMRKNPNAKLKNFSVKRCPDCKTYRGLNLVVSRINAGLFWHENIATCCSKCPACGICMTIVSTKNENDPSISTITEQCLQCLQ